MFLQKKYKELDGAWEERGVIGTRIEINGRRITVLWRNSPVLETTFRPEEKDGKVYLMLAKRGKRYAGSYTDYAEITELVYADGALDVTEFFPITGESRTHLTKTENSRYGNYTIVDDVLKQLEGKWKASSEYFSLSFHRDEITLNGEKRKIHVLKSNDSYTGTHDYIIADADPSVYEWQGFSRLEYDGNTITARMLIFDAPAPMIVTFTKETDS